MVSETCPLTNSCVVLSVSGVDFLFFLVRVQVEFYVNENTFKERLKLFFIKNQRSSEYRPSSQFKNNTMKLKHLWLIKLRCICIYVYMQSHLSPLQAWGSVCSTSLWSCSPVSCTLSEWWQTTLCREPTAATVQGSRAVATATANGVFTHRIMCFEILKLCLNVSQTRRKFARSASVLIPLQKVFIFI